MHKLIRDSVSKLAREQAHQSSSSSETKIANSSEKERAHQRVSSSKSKLIKDQAYQRAYSLSLTFGASQYFVLLNFMGTVLDLLRLGLRGNWTGLDKNLYLKVSFFVEFFRAYHSTKRSINSYVS